MLRICRNNKVTGKLTAAEVEDLSKAFNRAKKPISSIRRLLEHEIVAIDKKLANTEELYKKQRADLYTAALLAEKGRLMWMHNLLEKTIDDHQEDK
jgi:hypothetical protein